MRTSYPLYDVARHEITRRLRAADTERRRRPARSTVRQTRPGDAATLRR